MRKLLAAMVAVLLCCTATFAQTGKAKSALGFKAGMNVSTFRTAVDYSDFESSLKVGYVLGAFVEIPLKSRFVLQPEFLYSQMGSKGSSSEWGSVTFKYNYFSIPLLLKYKVAKSFTVFAGPEADFLIRARQKDFFRTTTITNDIQDFDCGFTVGAEYWFSKSWVLGARYIHGINDVSLDDEGHTFFNQGLQVNVGYKLFRKIKKAKKEKKK
jgi:Outer membrane protein beta-barrel domain